jgi:hypothetical protein
MISCTATMLSNSGGSLTVSTPAPIARSRDAVRLTALRLAGSASSQVGVLITAKRDLREGRAMVSGTPASTAWATRMSSGVAAITPSASKPRASGLMPPIESPPSVDL